MWTNPLVHRRDELRALKKALGAELAAFRADTEFRKTEEESKIFVELLKIACHLEVVSDRKLSDDLALEISTVARWRKGESVPPKRKQIQIMDYVWHQMDDAISRLEKDAVLLDQRMKKLELQRSRKVPA